MKAIEIKKALNELPAVLVEFRDGVEKKTSEWLFNLKHTIDNYDFSNLGKNESKGEVIYREFGMLGRNIYFEYRVNDLIKLAKKIADEKVANLYYKVVGKTGKIIDCSDLYLGINGDINGTIKGENATVNVQTIGAGGYNIQRYHFRTLIK